jgi:hypothetical protein
MCRRRFRGPASPRRRSEVPPNARARHDPAAGIAQLLVSVGMRLTCPEHAPSTLVLCLTTPVPDAMQEQDHAVCHPSMDLRPKPTD